MDSSTSLKVDQIVKLDGLVALITGGGTGIGLVIARALASNGAKVYIGSRRTDVVTEVSKAHGLIPLTLDVTSKASIKEAVDFIDSREGKLNILVNNAGVCGARRTFIFNPNAPERQSTAAYGNALFECEEFSEWAEILKTNVASAYFVTTAFIDLLERGAKLVDEGTSSVINVTTAQTSMKLSMGVFSYAASKAALADLTRKMAHDFATKDIPIRVNAIAPGLFPSEMIGNREVVERIARNPLGSLQHPIPCHRAGSDEELAAAVLYLSSRGGGYTNGHELVIDGGLSLVNP